MMLQPLSLLALLAVTAPGPAATQAQRTVVFLGDSLTAGYGLAPEQAFPSLVQQRIRAAGLPWRVVNAGVSGDTSAGARARLEFVLRQHPDLIFLCIGSNDGLRGLPVAELEGNLRAILERARAAGVRVVLSGAMLPENYGKDYRAAFQAVYPRLAKEFHAGFQPFLLEGVAMVPALNQDDGIHPNAAGARLVAEHVWNVLAPELARFKAR